MDSSSVSDGSSSTTSTRTGLPSGLSSSGCFPGAPLEDEAEAGRRNDTEDDEVTVMPVSLTRPRESSLAPFCESPENPPALCPSPGPPPAAPTLLALRLPRVSPRPRPAPAHLRLLPRDYAGNGTRPARRGLPIGPAPAKPGTWTRVPLLAPSGPLPAPEPRQAPAAEPGRPRLRPTPGPTWAAPRAAQVDHHFLSIAPGH